MAHIGFCNVRQRRIPLDKSRAKPFGATVVKSCILLTVQTKRSKLQRFEPDGFPVFITTSTHQKKPVFTGSAPSRTLCDLIFSLKEEHRVKILSFVVMPNHIHLILFGRTQKEISMYVQSLKRRSARIVNFHGKSQGSIWSPRYFDRVLRSEEELNNAITYVHYNPVKAGLVGEPEGYVYSSANGRWKTDLEDFLAGRFHDTL